MSLRWTSAWRVFLWALMLGGCYSMTFCDSSFCLLRPLQQNRLPPPFPGETVPLLVHAHMCCSPAAQNPHPSLPLFCSSQHKLYSIQMCFDGRRFSWVVLVIFQQLVLVQVLWVRAFNRSSIAFVRAPFFYTAC